MADDILEQIGRYRAPAQLPPIAMQGFHMYEQAGFHVSDVVVEALRLALAEHKDDLKALTDANVGLGVFALYLRDTRNDGDGAEKIAALIRETAPKYQSIGERIVAALQDLAENATSLLDRFSDRDQEAKVRAPQHDGEAPKGTFQLKDLKPVGDLRERPRASSPEASPPTGAPGSRKPD